jgi:hypothetical protein
MRGATRCSMAAARGASRPPKLIPMSGQGHSAPVSKETQVRAERQVGEGRSSARNRRLVDESAKPALPRSGATLPEAANGRSRIQHGYGSTRRVVTYATPGYMTLPRKLRHLEVPIQQIHGQVAIDQPAGPVLFRRARLAYRRNPGCTRPSPSDPDPWATAVRPQGCPRRDSAGISMGFHQYTLERETAYREVRSCIHMAERAIPL